MVNELTIPRTTTEDEKEGSPEYTTHMVFLVTTPKDEMDCRVPGYPMSSQSGINNLCTDETPIELCQLSEDDVFITEVLEAGEKRLVSLGSKAAVNQELQGILDQGVFEIFKGGGSIPNGAIIFP